MQIIKRRTLATGEQVVIVDTEASGQPLQGSRPVHIIRVVRVPAGTQYTGARTKGAKVLHSKQFDERALCCVSRAKLLSDALSVLESQTSIALAAVAA